ncbi:MAG TPA: GerW family sporulation protein [Candidatus Eisenbergiella merdavium]|uniref:GerW family sporulation protein n=2 Tax=Lachnospiraceae TaxID=186803 RepID=A0A9D2NFU3_9FIRM|nr:GerW family sporulation protein [Candidatus Enterocloster excrementipullorum]HJC24697.1 GerW family sporulation protein [Candidatus Eisenbergiella merdavium]
MAENQFTSTIESLFKGLDQFVTTKTVVGEPVQVGETIIVPLIDVTCGMAAGAFAEGGKQKQRGGGGMSAKMSPSAVLIIQGGVTKLVNVKNQDAITKAMDMAPDLINKFLGGKPAVSEETVQTAKDTAAAYDKGPERMDE